MRTTARIRFPAAEVAANVAETDPTPVLSTAVDCANTIPVAGCVVVVVDVDGAVVVVLTVVVVVDDGAAVVVVVVAPVAHAGSALQMFKRPPVRTRPSSDGRTSTPSSRVARSACADW